MIIIIIILIVILFFILYFSNDIERYTNLKMEYEILNKLDGVNENGSDNEYDILDTNNTYHRYKNVYRYNELNANQWDKRQPGMINQQYSYDDRPSGSKVDILDSIRGTANLKELPINFNNQYVGSIGITDANLSRLASGYYNYPNVMTLRNLQSQCSGITGIPYSPFYGQNKHFGNISGFNPNSILPAQYADRSKTSKESLLTKGIMKAIRDQPGYLPCDNIGPI